MHLLFLRDFVNDKAFFACTLNTSSKMFYCLWKTMPIKWFIKKKKMINNKNCLFSIEHYKEKSQECVHCKWICYSKLLDFVYCQPYIKFYYTTGKGHLKLLV